MKYFPQFTVFKVEIGLFAPNSPAFKVEEIHVSLKRKPPVIKTKSIQHIESL
jgi:hypothetical protein